MCCWSLCTIQHSSVWQLWLWVMLRCWAPGWPFYLFVCLSVCDWLFTFAIQDGYVVCGQFGLTLHPNHQRTAPSVKSNTQVYNYNVVKDFFSYITQLVIFAFQSSKVRNILTLFRSSLKHNMSLTFKLHIICTTACFQLEYTFQTRMMGIVAKFKLEH